MKQCVVLKHRRIITLMAYKTKLKVPRLRYVARNFSSGTREDGN